MSPPAPSIKHYLADYKVISNANFRFIGNLSTKQDIERVRTGLSLGADAFHVISGLKTRQFYYQLVDQGESRILSSRWLISYHRGPLEPLEIRRLKEGVAPEEMTVRAVPLAVPEEVFLRDTDRKRAKKGILGGTEEKVVFAKKIFLPYLDFTYRFPAEKGLLSKQMVMSEGRSTVLALREANFGFDPKLVELASILADMELDSASVINGVDSTVLVSERLAELKNLLRDYEVQSEERSKQYEALPKGNPTRENLKENIEFLRKTKLLRWKMFADGLQLPTRLDLDKLELLDGTLFYLPYFIAKLSRGGEARYIVWNREGREDDTIADEMTKNKKFRTLIETHALPQTV